MQAICRDCLKEVELRAGRCALCGRMRIVRHPELERLGIAHVDCDSFYAAVEKRDAPELASRPVIVGGGTRGVVATCCYVARISGVRSAMPMWQALKRCPDAVVIRPRMEHYAAVSRQIRALFAELTPLIEPLSLDEAFLDLRGTDRLHGMPPALALIRLAARIEAEIGVSVSIGLSHNKFLAKIASDLDKPRGFSIIGEGDTRAFLRDKPVSILWGVGDATRRALADAGLRTLEDIRRAGRDTMIRKLGGQGMRLFALANGEDARQVSPDQKIKSVSNETTFSEDITDPEILMQQLWRMAEKASDRMKAKGLMGRSVTLKLKRADFTAISRQRQLDEPSQLADTLFKTGREMFGQLPRGVSYRLIGIGYGELSTTDGRDPVGDLLDPQARARAGAERARDLIRARFGSDAIAMGRGLPRGKEPPG